jgi:1,4-dihydroxy-2-naphthoate octaprenyltransferase
LQINQQAHALLFCLFTFVVVKTNPLMISPWIRAMRLRTLPLAISGILMGSVLAELSGYQGDKLITLLCLLTAVFLQVLSNLANDYGDFVKGTDNEKRIGNERALQSGAIKPKSMLAAIWLFAVLCLLSGCTLLAIAGQGNLNLAFALFFILGLAAIAAAIKYTMGKYAYGYSGLGDVFVFVFFGPVAVLGAYILQRHFAFNWYTDKWMLLPAITVGLLSTAVLNTNNIRDIDNDRASGKRTIVVQMGVSKARLYHWLLVLVAACCLFVFIVFNQLHWIQYLSLLAFYPIFRQAFLVSRTAPSPAYNAFLKQLSLSTLMLVVVFMVMQTIALGIYVNDAIHKFM